jgi:hypothetical protein
MSLKANARIAGLLYVAASVIGIVRLLYVPSKLFVHGDAAGTAANIVAHETLFRFGIVAYIVGAALWLFVPLALYQLLKGVDRDLAILMVVFGSLMIFAGLWLIPFGLLVYRSGFLPRVLGA